jgi:hypothetical protein
VLDAPVAEAIAVAIPPVVITLADPEAVVFEVGPGPGYDVAYREEQTEWRVDWREQQEWRVDPREEQRREHRTDWREKKTKAA